MKQNEQNVNICYNINALQYPGEKKSIEEESSFISAWV